MSGGRVKTGIRGGVVALALVALSALSAGSAQGQTLADYDYENLTFRGIGVDVGYIWPSKVQSTTTYGMHLDLGYLGPGIRIMPGLSYWSSTMKASELNRLAAQLNKLPGMGTSPISGDELGPIDWSDLSLEVAADYVWVAPANVFTYLGASVGVHALNGQGPVIDNTFIEDLLDSITPSVAAIAGVEYQPLSRLRVFGEARYTLMTDIHYPGLHVGVALLLPPRGTGEDAGGGAPGSGGAR